MRFSNPGQVYSQQDEQRFRQAVSQADDQNRKTGRDLELAVTERLIMTDTVTGTRYAITVESGALVLTAL